MEDLIYKFLIQSGFPRASIVTDIAAVDHNAEAADASFVVVDPQSTESLAVLKVVGPVNAETLINQSALLATVANRIGGKQVQAFVVRVDLQAKREAEQVQFYRCHPNTELQQITARTFPDFDSLRVSYKLMADKSTTEPEFVDFDEDEYAYTRNLGISGILPGLVLLILALIDWALGFGKGLELLSVTQAILLVGAASLLTLPALLRYLRN